ncbi:uncharacterized protein E0L32_003769 [Thyridium curvatum]|uniref:Uncharacterized protein n=1 Tax=Thyridium curvatum TaxID=1093900 RepID=A0A507B058_9PEZI|nr:uncharacterized protein E0L32_003769 [Thyridium curvatum]TPX16475.1 hypothetical protein E0L32_003769 [Thyridium curvatum]
MFSLAHRPKRRVKGKDSTTNSAHISGHPPVAQPPASSLANPSAQIPSPLNLSSDVKQQLHQSPAAEEHYPSGVQTGFVPARGDDVEPPRTRRPARQAKAKGRKVIGRKQEPRRNSTSQRDRAVQSPRLQGKPAERKRNSSGPRLDKNRDRRLAQLLDAYSKESPDVSHSYQAIQDVLNGQLLGFAPAHEILKHDRLGDFAIAFEMYEPAVGATGVRASKRIKIFVSRLIDSILSKTQRGAVAYEPGDGNSVEFYQRFLNVFKRGRHQDAEYLQAETLHGLVTNLALARKRFLQDLQVHGLSVAPDEAMEMDEQHEDDSDVEEKQTQKPCLPDVLEMEDEQQLPDVSAAKRDNRLAALFDQWIAFTDADPNNIALDEAMDSIRQL